MYLTISEVYPHSDQKGLYFELASSCRSYGCSGRG